MVSRRNFFTIMTLLGIMVFMFMFVSVIKQEFHTFDQNTNGDSLQDKDREELLERFRSRGENAALGQEIYYLTGNEKSPVDQVVDAWCTYTGRSYTTGSSIWDAGISGEHFPELILINAQDLTLEEDVALLEAYARQGVCLIFATLPGPQVIENNPALQELLGITNVYSHRVWLDELHLFSGLLIGGGAIYQGDSGNKNREDKAFLMPWYMVGEGTKTYMMGTLRDSELEDQFMPTVIWRNAVGKGKVFCVNGDFMKSMEGMGFLSAFLAEKDSYDIYPVVNAQNLVLVNFGGFSNENTDILMGEYSQTQTQFFRDVVWPAMIALNERTQGKISMMVAPQMDYWDDQEPISGKLIYYLRLLKENNGEAGISGDSMSQIGLREKSDRDLTYWSSECKTYEIRSAYLPDRERLWILQESLSGLRTAVCPGEEMLPVDYGEGLLTIQTPTSNGRIHSMEDDLAVKLYETALGYSCISVDLSEVSHPREENYWETYVEELSRHLSTYWRDYRGFDQTTLSESDSRIRQFLALEYRDDRREDTITLQVEGLKDTAYFILKLNREELDPSSQVSYTDLGNGFYLLEVTDRETSLTVRRPGSFYYE